MVRSLTNRRLAFGITLLVTCLAVPLRADDQGLSDEAWDAVLSTPIHSRINVIFHDGSEIEGRIAAVVADGLVVDQVKIGRRWLSRSGDPRPEDGLTIRRERVASVSVVAAARAPQAKAGSFEQLQVLVRSGDRIQVTDSTGSHLSGTIMNLTPSLLSLKVGDSIRELTQGDVALIQQRRGDPLANGALVGLGVGAGFGAVLCGRCHVGPGLVAAAVYGGIGTAIGVGVDAMVRGDIVLFQQRPGSRARISVAPQLARSHKGVTVSVRF